MREQINNEKWVKRWLKRTVSITLGVVVGVLINGGVVFAQDTASLEATVRAQQEQINALIKEVNALKNELSTREQVAAKKVRSVEVTPMGTSAPVTGGENTPVALSGVDTITGVGPVTVSTNDRNANISLRDKFTKGNIHMDFTNGNMKVEKLTVDGMSINNEGIHLGGKKITNLGAGKQDGDAVNFEQLTKVEKEVEGIKEKSRFPIYAGDNRGEFRVGTDSLIFTPEDGINITGNGSGQVKIGLAKKIPEKLNIQINGSNGQVDLNDGILAFNSGKGIGINGDGNGGMTISSTFEPATRLQIGIDSTGADVDLINGRLHFISENGITMYGNGSGNVNIGLTDNIELGKLKLQGPNGIIHLGNDTILESSHFKVGKMDFNGKEAGTGINMNGLPLTGLKDAAVDGDAVNYGQFKIVQEKVKSNETGLNSIKNFDYSGDSGTGTLILGSESSRFNVHGDGSNISTVASDKGVEVNLNQKLAIGGITVDGTNNQILIGQDKICLSTNETKLNGVTIGEKEINAGGKKIGGLAPGTNEGDAISYSQYYGPIRMGITNESNGESSFKNINIHNSGYSYIFSNGLNGEWCGANTIKIGLGNKVEIKSDPSKGTGNIILEAVGNNSSIKLQDLKISNTGITVPNNSTVKIGDITIDGHSMNFGTQKLTITPDSINVGGGKITNVGAGKVAGDAVNYGQLTGVANKVKSLEESLNASGQLKYTGETGTGEINLRNKKLSLKGDEAITTTASDNGVTVSLKNKFTKGKLSVNSDLGTVQLGGKLPGESKLELSPDSIKAGALEWKDNELKLGNISMKNNNMSIGETKIESNSIQFNEGQIKGLKSPVQKDEAVNLGYLQEKEAAIKGELEKPFILVDSTGKKHELTKETGMKFDNSTPIKLYEENGTYKFDVLGNFEIKNPKGQRVFLFDVESNEPRIVFDNKGLEITPSKMKLGLIEISTNQIVVGPNGIAIDFNSGISLNQKKLTGIPDPENDDDAVNYKTLCESTKTLESHVTAVNTKVDRIKDFNYKTDNNVKMSIDLTKKGSIFGINGDESTIETSSTGKGDVKIGLKDKVVKNNFTLDSKSGTIELKNSSGKTAKLTPTFLQFGDVKIEDTGINAGNLAIGEVADGVKPNDAVNKAQLDIVKGIANNAQEFANKGWYYKTDSNKSDVLDEENVIKPGETFNVVGSGAIRTLATKIDDGAEKGKKQLVIEVKDKFKEGEFEVDKEIGEIKIHSVSLSENGLIIAHSEGSAYDTVISSKDIKFGGKTVQGVGAGKKDDDAVNVGQLNKQIIRIENNEGSIASNQTAINKNKTLIEQNSKLKYEGDTNKGEMPIATGTLAIKGSGGIVTAADDQNKGHITIGLKNKFEVGSLNFDGTDGKIYVGNCNFGVDGLKVGVVELKNESKTETGETVPQILEMQGVKITGLPDGQKDDDAVNYGQLSKVDAKANNALKGWKYKTDTIGTGVDTVIKPEGTFTIKGDGKTIKTSSLNNGTVEVGLKDEFKLNNMSVDTKTATFVFETKDESGTAPKTFKTQLSSKGVDIGDTHLTETGLKVGNIEIAQNGINASGNKITGVADGGEDVTDAVNYGQLKAVKEELETTTGTLNQGWKYAADGTALGSEGVIKPGDTLRINGSEAIKTSIDNGTENSVKIALKDNFTVNNMSVDTKVGELKFTGKETDGKGNVTNFATIVNSKGITAGGVSLTHSGIDAGGKKITHLAPGKDDEDAVNMKQWKLIEQLVKDKTDDNEVTIESISKLGFGAGNGSFRMRLDNGTLFIEGADSLGPIVTTATYEENTDKTKPSTGRVKIGIRDKFKVNNMDVDTIGATFVMETEEGSGTATKTYKTKLSSKGVDIGDTHLTETGLKVGKIQIAQNGINVSGNKITGVAAGGEDVTDAVNYGQLQKVEKDLAETTATLNKGWNYAADTMGTGVDNVIKPDGTFTIKGDGKAIKTSSTENGAVSIGLEKKFNVEKFGVDMDEGTLVLGGIGGKTIYSPTGVKAGDVSLTHSGIDAGNKQIANVAEGTNPLDAVNFSQLEGISEKVEKNKIFRYEGDTGKEEIDLSKERPLLIVGGKAIKTHAETTVDPEDNTKVNHKLVVELRKEFTTGLMGVDADKGVIAIGKVTQDENGKDIQEDAVIHDGDGIHVGRNISITKENGINAGNKIITNVADGNNSDDAVNKGQLDTVSNALAETNEAVAKGWNYAADDTTLGKEKNIQHGDTLKIKGSDAIETSIDTGTDGSENGVKIALKDEFEVNNMSVDTKVGELTLSSEVTDSAGRKEKLSSTFSSKGVEVGDSHLTKDGLSVGNVKVAASGIDAGKHRITKVADGSADEDAVNKKQLNIVDAKVNKNTTDISNLALNYAGNTGAGKVKLTETFAVKGDGNVVTTVPSPNGGIKISLADDIKLGTKVEIKGDTGFYIKDANVSVTDAGFKAGDVLMSSTGLTAGGVSVGADGINAGSKKITDVATGTIATDAVNYGQLQKVEKDLAETTATLNKGWKYAADGTILGSEGVIKPGETLSIKGSEAIKTSMDTGAEGTEKSVKIALKDNFTVNNMNVDTKKGELTLLSSITDTDVTETNFKSTFSSKGVEVGNSHLTKDGLAVGNVVMSSTGLTAGGVSVSANGIDAGNKKITKVATGTEDEDAVNFGQLTAVEKKADKNTTDISNLALNYAGNTGTGKVKLTDTFAVKGDGNVVTDVPSPNGGIKISLAKDIELGTKVEIKGDTGFYIKDAGVVVTEKGFRAGNVVMSSTGLEAEGVSVGADGINAGNKKITKVATGTEDEDAVNYGQLKAVKEKLETTTGTLNQGWKYAADGTVLGSEGVIKHGDTLKIKGSEAIKTSIDGTENSVKIALKDNFKLNKMDVNTNAGSIVLRDERTVSDTEDKEIFETTLNPEGVKVGTLSMTKNGINAGNKKITGVAAGGENTTDAVNFGQLSEVKTMVNDNAGKIAANSKLKYSADTGQHTMNLNGDTLTLKGDGNGIKTHIDNESGNVIIGLKDTVTIGNKLNLNGDAGKISITGSPLSIDGDGLYVDGIRITKDGISVGNKSITLLAGGKADTDAVNVKQLNEVKAEIESTSHKVSQNTSLKFSGNMESSEVKLANESLNIKGGDQDIIFTKAYEHITETSTEKGIEIGIKDQFTLGKLIVNAKDGILHIGGHDWTLSNNGLDMGAVKVLKDDIDVGGNVIKNVKPGSDGKDAVNVDQLDEVKTQIQTTDDRISDVATKGVVIAGNDQVNIKKGLGEALIIRGNDVGQVSDITANYTPDNIATYNDGNRLRIAMAKSPKFESININGVKISSNSGGRMTVVNLSDSGQPVELRGIAPGTSEDSVVTKKQFDEAINKNSAAVEGASLKYAGNTAETVGKDYKMSLKTDTLTIKGNESSKNIVTTTKDNGTIELDLSDTVTIGESGNEVKIDGKTGTVTTGNTVISKNNVKTDSANIGGVTIQGNKISGLADGERPDEAVTVRQLENMKNTVVGDAADAALGKIKVNYEGNTNNEKNVPLTNGEINVVVKGESKNRTDGKTNIVSSVKDTGEIDLDLDKKVVIGKGANQITINGDDTDSDGGAIKVGSTEIKKDAIDVKLDTGKKVVINNKGINAGHSAITNVADGVNDTDAVNVRQLKELSSRVTSSSTIVKGSGAAIVTPVTEEGHKGYNVHVDKVVQFTDKDGRDVVKVGNNFHVVKNGVVSSTTIAPKDIYTRMVNPDGTTTTPTKLGNVAPGKVAPGSTDAVNGSQLYETQQMMVNNNGLAQQNAKAIHDLRRDHNDGMAQMAAMNAVDFSGVSPNKMKIGAGIGGYRGSSAVAVGVAISPSEAVMINAKWATPTNTCRRSAFGIGATYEFNYD